MDAKESLIDERKPIFEFEKGKFYYERLWFVGCPDKDLMGAVLRRLPDGPWEIRYRFRYYEDKDYGLLSKDRKSTYGFVGKNADESLLNDAVLTMRTVVSLTAERFRAEHPGVRIDCDELESQKRRSRSDP